jgi:hypothetical protein
LTEVEDNNLFKEGCQSVTERGNMPSTEKEFGVEENYVDSANIAGFKSVADAMIAEGDIEIFILE